MTVSARGNDNQENGGDSAINDGQKTDGDSAKIVNSSPTPTPLTTNN